MLIRCYRHCAPLERKTRHRIRIKSTHCTPRECGRLCLSGAIDIALLWSGRVLGKPVGRKSLSCILPIRNLHIALRWSAVECANALCYRHCAPLERKSFGKTRRQEILFLHSTDTKSTHCTPRECGNLVIALAIDIALLWSGRVLGKPVGSEIPFLHSTDTKSTHCTPLECGNSTLRWL